MAVAPVFLSSMSVLKGRLRLSGTISSDAAAILDQAVLDVRIQLYAKLGSTLITTIKVTSAVDDPDTTEELRRARADSLEAAWVRRVLLDRLPSLLIDGSAWVREVWNQEGFTRRAGGRELDQMKGALDAEISDHLVALLGDPLSLVGNFAIINVEPVAGSRPEPGDTVWDVELATAEADEGE